MEFLMFLKKIIVFYFLTYLLGSFLFATQNDINGDGKADILWRDGSVNHLWRMQDDGSHLYKNIGRKASKYTNIGIADFNKDEVSDILWKNGRYYAIWYMNADGTHRYKYIGQKSEKYVVVAVADFNEDGIADILWKKGKYCSLWYMNEDGTHRYKYIGQKSLVYSIVAVADYNGDGEADILWKKDKYYAIWYMNIDGTHRYKYIGSKPLEYMVISSADLDGDGGADILWKNGSKNVVWYMNVDGTHRYKNIGRKNSKYTPRMVADFNNDGRADILWQNRYYYAIWYMNTDGTHRYKYIGTKPRNYYVTQNFTAEPKSTIYENAEKRISAQWKQISGSYAPLRVADGFNSQGALVLTPEWIDDYTNKSEFHLEMNNTIQKILEVDMGGLANYRLENREDRGFIQHHSIGVYVHTKNGTRALLWDSFFNHGKVQPFSNNGYWLNYPSPVEHVRGYTDVGGLAVDQWVHFKVDVEKELQKLESNNTIISIDTFFATGGFLDNLKLSKY